jgi:hypothetical protein
MIARGLAPACTVRGRGRLGILGIAIHRRFDLESEMRILRAISFLLPALVWSCAPLDVAAPGKGTIEGHLRLVPREG